MSFISLISLAFPLLCEADFFFFFACLLASFHVACVLHHFFWLIQDSVCLPIGYMAEGAFIKRE